jgi:hypothetical protein
VTDPIVGIIVSVIIVGINVGSSVDIGVAKQEILV